MSPACAECGTEPRARARFCDACGAALAPAPHHPEFKQVTVVFADVVRSMDLASVLGTERLREVMSELYRRSRDIVRRYGGSVDFTGDGIMAVFGAPVALEDHALRACLTALDLQAEAAVLAADMRRRDGTGLQLRVGLNSGQVIAGELGSGPGSYTTIGAHVGLAQRMEAAAPPGGVMLSGSTARLVEGIAEVGAPESVRIKNSDVPVSARRLRSISATRTRGSPSRLVGRDAEMQMLRAHLDAAQQGGGKVIGVIGPPGIGKSRLVAETVRLGEARGLGVAATFCEAHARDVPFHAAARLFRSLTGVGSVRGPAARHRVRLRLSDADPADLQLLDDLLGIGEPDVRAPAIDPDARRRRLSALLTTASRADAAPALYVIEDAHWIDEASESTITEFLTKLRGTRSLAVITYRPEYRGALAEIAAASAIPLRPLDDSYSAALIAYLLGPDPSVATVAGAIADRAAGNPFFAEEIVRDLAERGVLQGSTGCYVAGADATVTGVPATLQATIGARIDRLGETAKDALNAAAVIGSRFARDRLAGLVDQVCLDELLSAEMIEPVPERTDVFAFRHPLIRTVAYESQLRSDRARLHRSLATAIERDGPGTPDENAALIATHLEGAGDLRSAICWHMRSGTWLAMRDNDAARASWRRAAELAERLDADEPDRPAALIEARTALCGSAWRAGLAEAQTAFDDLRRLCAEHRDRRSLAMGMAGYVMALTFHDRPREASVRATELLDLLERIDDKALTVGVSFGVLAAKWETGEVREVFRLAQRVIEMDPVLVSVGSPFVGSPLTLAYAMRGVAGMCLGQPGWKDDLDRAIDTARALDPLINTVAVLHKYAQIGLGALCASAAALRDTAESLAVAQRSGDDFTVVHAHLARGIVLVARKGAEREVGFGHLHTAREAALRGCGNASIVHIADIQFARRRWLCGDYDGAAVLADAVVDALFDLGSVVWRGPATAVLVEALLKRNRHGDLAAARAAIDRLAAARGFVLQDVTLLRLRALAAGAAGDADGYRSFAARYREAAGSGGFEGHAAVAARMT
ncbi:ATP-binding protein [Mycobacterium sp. NPDC003323]